MTCLRTIASWAPSNLGTPARFAPAARAPAGTRQRIEKTKAAARPMGRGLVGTSGERIVVMA